MPASRYAASRGQLRVGHLAAIPFAHLDSSRPLLADSCSALMATNSRLPRARAISGVVTMAQAAPSLTPQQSNTPRGSATMGARSMVSTSTTRRKCALGLRAPF